MELTKYAPEEFKLHLKVLENMAKFNKARIRCELGIGKMHQHYVITGNDGTGKEEAVHKIFDLMSDAAGINSIYTIDAISAFDNNDGYAPAMSSCQDNTLIHIKNADRLGMKGNINQSTGIEDLCNMIPTKDNCIVVLTGKRSRLLELVNSHENARERFTHVFHFDDLSPQAMLEYMIDLINRKNYQLDVAAEAALKDYLTFIYKLRGSNFSNIHFLHDLFDKEIIPRMSERVITQELPIEELDLCTIMPEDLPNIKKPNTAEAVEKLEALVGLDDVKKQILDHTALVKLNNLRASKGLFNKTPPMHMVFTGNPGTGKTTIAKHIGEIYHSIGVLSSGHVVETDRTKLVGEFIGITEKNTVNAINSASGGVLFIDEAYNLFTESDNKRDFGMRVIETLLTYLGNEDSDMIVILAGYTSEMERMLEANPGMKSRFPYIFHFEDYTPEQLMQIGKRVLEKEHYKLSPEAEQKLAKYVIHEYDQKDSHFGNGRFITRLITAHIIPSLSRRLMTKADDDISVDEMSTIEACDIPDSETQINQPKELDETILANALERLDSLVGVQNAKLALNDYASISRLRHQQGTLKIAPDNLCWNFIGKTGTGKSTVAEILSKILQGLGILKRGHTVCVSADELAGTDCYLVLERVVKEANEGLLFLDLDAPSVKDANKSYLQMWILNKMKELQQTSAIVFAQAQASADMIALNLATNGIAVYGNSIVFNDFSAKELYEILAAMLDNDYHLKVMPNAKTYILRYIESVKASETKESPVNARTIFHLAQTIAHITQLRMVNEKGELQVTPEDVAHFQWDSKLSGKVGFV